MTRIAVIGAGAHSREVHGPAMQHVAGRDGHVELAAVCDLDRPAAERYAEAFGFAAVYEDYHAMLAAEALDGLVAITPVSATRRIVGELLTTGIPLLLEKPPGADSAEALELLEIARAHDAPHMISFNRRFGPGAVRAGQWLEEHTTGRPVETVLARMYRVARRDRDFVTSTAIHLADAVLSFMPPPEQVASRRRQTPLAEAGEPAQSCEAWIAFQGGATASLIVAPAAGVHEETYELIGPEYTARIDAARCCVSVFDRKREALHWDAPADMPEWARHGAVGETEAFVAAVRGEGPLGPTLADGLLALRVAEAMDAGSEDDRVTSGPPVGP